MKTSAKKELRQVTEKTLRDLFAKHEIASPSKRAQRKLNKLTKRISNTLKQEIKKKFKQSKKANSKKRSIEQTEAA